MGEPFVLGVLITGQVLLLAWIAWKAFDRKRLEPYPLPPAMP